MAITGNLKTFYLSSLLQLLSNDKKTGILELTDGHDIVQVYLRDGTIINAFGSSRVERLTNYLQSEGIITEEQLDRCMKISAHTEKKIGMVLVEQGIISPEQLEDLLHRQIEQTLYSLFLWEEGEFQYRDQDFDLSGQIITSFDTMEVVLEASRRVDEISEIKKRVPQDNQALAINPELVEQQKAKLNTVERAILSLVNGKRTVKRVIADSGYDELKVYKTLFSLVASGLIFEEGKTLKRPAEVHEEIEDPAEAAISENSTRSEIRERSDLHAEQAGEFLDTSADTQPDTDVEQNAPDEMVLEPEPATPEQPAEKDEAVSELLESLSLDVDQPDKTIVKIDGKLIDEKEAQDSELARFAKAEPAGKKLPDDMIQNFRISADEEEGQEEYVREKQRLLKKAAVIAAAVIALLVVVLLLFSGGPEEPVQTQTTDQQPIIKKKPKKAVTQKAKKTDGQEKQTAAPKPVPAQPEPVFEFFQDQKGWISINLPAGFTVSEQPYQDRTSVSIVYENDISVEISIVPESADWDAEEQMYATLVKIQKDGAQQVQKYTTLKHAGCPGYVLFFESSLHQKIRHTALYRFVCYNRSVRLDVTSPEWQIPAVQELSEKIYAAIESSFFIYQ